MEEEMQNLIEKGGSVLKYMNNDEDQVTSEMEIDENRVESPKFYHEGISIELIGLFQNAVNSHDWKHAESLILLANPETLNGFLGTSLDPIWLLSTKQEWFGLTGLIRKIISNGACDFRKATLSTTFLAPVFLACQCAAVSLVDTPTFVAQKFCERIQECDAADVLMDRTHPNIKKITEWALKCSQSWCHKSTDRENHEETVAQLRLSAFRMFLELAGENLTQEDFREAFGSSCIFLAFLSNSCYPGWSYGTSGSVVRGVLEMLVESGADDVNQSLVQASYVGSTELVRILLQIAERNNLEADVDSALDFASKYGRIDTMECLVKEGNATEFKIERLVEGAERGCLPAVEWYVKRGCLDMELCLALTSATFSSQIEVAPYLLPWIPQHFLAIRSIEILHVAGERSEGSFDGISFLLRSNFVGDPAFTYAIADYVAMSEDKDVDSRFITFLRDNWSLVS